MLGVTAAIAGIIALTGVGGYVLAKTIENYRPGRKKIQKDLAEIRGELTPYVNQLVKWSDEEMEQMSLNRTNNMTRKRVVTTSKGVFTTIYHEPLMAYFYKKYVSTSENSLLYARTTDHEFIYRMKNGVTEVMVNDKLLGTINEKGTLLAGKDNKPIAQLHLESSQMLLPVLVHGKQVGTLINPAKNRKTNPRAFEMLKKMSDEEEEIFLSLSILELVKRGM